MKNLVKSVAVLMAILMISSVVMASPNGNASNCDTNQTDAATWGANTATWGGNGNSSTVACQPQVVKQTSVYTTERLQPTGHRFFHGIWQSIETAIWGPGFVPPPVR